MWRYCTTICLQQSKRGIPATVDQYHMYVQKQAWTHSVYLYHSVTKKPRVLSVECSVRYYRPHPKDGGTFQPTGGYLPSRQWGGGGVTYLPADGGGYLPSSWWEGYWYPLARVGTPPWSGYAHPLPRAITPPPLGDWAAQWVLATQQAVCLLRSRRRTFLCLVCSYSQFSCFANAILRLRKLSQLSKWDKTPLVQFARHRMCEIFSFILSPAGYAIKDNWKVAILYTLL